MNKYEYGPKYPPGEIVFIEEVGWATVKTTTWKENEWVYTVELDSKKEIEVKEWQILV